MLFALYLGICAYAYECRLCFLYDSLSAATCRACSRSRSRCAYARAVSASFSCCDVLRSCAPCARSRRCDCGGRGFGEGWLASFPASVTAPRASELVRTLARSRLEDELDVECVICELARETERVDTELVGVGTIVSEGASEELARSTWSRAGFAFDLRRTR